MQFAAQAHCDSRSRFEVALATNRARPSSPISIAVFTRIAKNTVVLAALFCQSPHNTIARARPAF